uniref:Ribosomal protein S18 n=1 Tax=Phaeophyceae sp. TaxID=2249243 RepID=A0A8E5BDJ3_9PHAE|nr:ribosomal protein S18 [Phaeophyceae sp.]
MLKLNFEKKKVKFNRDSQKKGAINRDSQKKDEIKAFKLPVNAKIKSQPLASLTSFLTSTGQIQSRYLTELTLKQQRHLSKVIKKARNQKLLPFIRDVEE